MQPTLSKPPRYNFDVAAPAVRQLAKGLPFLEPTLPALENVIRLYRDAYARGSLTNGGVVQRFESAAAEWLGVPHCVAVSSCTTGLMCVLKALDLKGEVVLPSFTFFATGHAALWSGLRPVFADCEPDTWTVDPQDVARKISRRTSALVGVHTFGNPCDVDALAKLASDSRVKVIYDAAHAFGSSYHGIQVGAFGDAEVFSLSPTKTLVAGEGGLVATHDSTLARRVRVARNYGDPGGYDCELIGLNARMSEFHASLAVAGIELVQEKIARHNRIAARYTDALQRLPGLRFQTVRPGSISTFKDYSICLDPDVCGISRDGLRQALKAGNIECRAYFSPALHQQRLYRKYARGAALAQSEAVANTVLSLPIYASLSDESVDRVIEGIEAVLSRVGAPA